MIVPSSGSLMITETPEYREVRWMSPQAKIMRVVLPLAVIIGLASPAIAYFQIKSNSPHTFVDPLMIFIPSTVMGIIFLVPLFLRLRYLLMPQAIRLYADHLELRAMVRMSGKIIVGKTVQLAREDVRSVAINSETIETAESGAFPIACCCLDTAQGPLKFASSLPDNDLATLAQLLGQWKG